MGLVTLTVACHANAVEHVRQTVEALPYIKMRDAGDYHGTPDVHNRAEFIVGCGCDYVMPPASLAIIRRKREQLGI